MDFNLHISWFDNRNRGNWNFPNTTTMQDFIIFCERQCGLVNLICAIVHSTKFVVPKSSNGDQKIPGQHSSHAQVEKRQTENDRKLGITYMIGEVRVQ